MAPRRASDVPVPELIRRGYDRAKGLGHDGIDGVLEVLRALAEPALPQATQGPEMAVLHPAVVAAAWAGGDREARAMVAWLLAAPDRLGVTHPLLMRQVAALQRAGLEIRPVVLWIAAMTVVPTWGAPGSAPPSDDADTTATVAAAAGLGAVAVVPASGKVEGTGTVPIRLVSI